MLSLKTFPWTNNKLGNKTNNTYPGSGVGARSTAVRRAILKRSSNPQSNCCAFVDISKK